MARKREQDRGLLTRPNQTGMRFLGLDIPFDHYVALRKAAEAAGQTTVSAIVRQIIQAWFQAQPLGKQFTPTQSAEAKVAPAASGEVPPSESVVIDLNDYPALQELQPLISPAERAISEADSAATNPHVKTTAEIAELISLSIERLSPDEKAKLRAHLDRGSR